MDGRDASLFSVETVGYAYQRDRSKGRGVARLVEEVEGLPTKGPAEEKEDPPASVRSTKFLTRRGPARKAGRVKLEGSERLKVCFTPLPAKGEQAREDIAWSGWNTARTGVRAACPVFKECPILGELHSRLGTFCSCDSAPSGRLLTYVQLRCVSAVPE